MGRTQRQRRQLEKFSSPAKSPTSLVFLSALFKHLNSQGWRNETALAVREFPTTGRGLCSKRHVFSAGDELIRLPVECLITVATLEADAEFKAQFLEGSFNKEQRVPFQSLLAFYLLYHNHLGQNSPRHAYLDSMPAAFTTPYFCPISELQCLPETILEKTVAQNRKIRESFENLRCMLASEMCACCGCKYFDDIYSLHDFKWAFFAVNSRSVFVPSRQLMLEKCFFQPLLGDEANLALAPLLDFFNHSDAVTSSADLVRNSASKALEFVLTLVQAPAAVQRRAQIFISYGTMTNLKLLTEYGFILPNNCHDYFEFSLLDLEHFIRSDKRFAAQIFHRNKFKFIRDHNLHDQMFVHSSDGASHNLCVVLHLLFKEQSYFPNVLNQVAFGDAAHLQAVEEEARLLIAYKMAEYQRFVADLDKLPVLSASGVVARNYLQECVKYLEKCMEII